MKQVDPCPSLGAYWRHRRRGEEPCQGCKRAAIAAIKRRAVERERARKQLAKEYPERYAEILSIIRDRTPKWDGIIAGREAGTMIRSPSVASFAVRSAEPY